MSALLKKELRLGALLLTYLFIGFGLMAMIPGYPILCGVFFITLGIFQSFLNAREANDLVYSVLLPVAKADVVKGKFLFAAFIELAGFAVMAVLTLVRMTLLKDAPVYRQNALMNANLFFLGTVLLIFGLFTLIFVGGYFKTGYKLGKPFVIYIIAAFLVVGAAEALHHFPGCGAVNAFGFDHLGLQFLLFACGAALYALLTFAAYRKACRDFEKIDL